MCLTFSQIKQYSEFGEIPKTWDHSQKGTVKITDDDDDDDSIDDTTSFLKFINNRLIG